MYHNRRAKVGKSSYGWFMGFKLHLIINHKAEIIAVKITNANKSDLSCVTSLTKGFLSINIRQCLFHAISWYLLSYL
jgi:hypothetical protein